MELARTTYRPILDDAGHFTVLGLLAIGREMRTGHPYLGGPLR